MKTLNAKQLDIISKTQICFKHFFENNGIIKTESNIKSFLSILRSALYNDSDLSFMDEFNMKETENNNCFRFMIYDEDNYIHNLAIVTFSLNQMNSSIMWFIPDTSMIQTLKRKTKT